MVGNRRRADEFEQRILAPGRLESDARVSTPTSSSSGRRAGAAADPFEETPYRVLRRLGSSGTAGHVFLVAHRGTGRHFVAKLAPLHSAGDPRLADRVRVEGQALGRLNHPNIVAVAGVGRTPDERPFLVTEYLEGRTLSVELLERKQLPVLEAITYACELLSALSSAHALGIVHRDVKPSNLFICRTPDRGRYLKVLDFGIARVMPDAPQGAPLPVALPTDSGVIVGTQRFISPEAATGAAVDARADVYSAALVLYLMLAGRGPFDDLGSDSQLSAARAETDPEPPSRFAEVPIPRELDRVIIKALERNQVDRFQTADDFRHALERIADDLTRPAGWLETTARPPVTAESSERAGPQSARTLVPSVIVARTAQGETRGVRPTTAEGNTDAAPNETPVGPSSFVRIATREPEVEPQPAAASVALPRSGRGLVWLFLVAVLAAAVLAGAAVYCLGSGAQ